MSSPTVDWANEVSTTFQTESSEAATERGSVSPSYLIPYKTSFVALGILGTLTNGFVLAGFWLSDRSKFTSSRVYIINHTTLEPSWHV